MNTMLLDGSQLTIDQVIALACGQTGAPDVALAADARQRVPRSGRVGMVADGPTGPFLFAEQLRTVVRGRPNARRRSG